jgi:hypothetical protein
MKKSSDKIIVLVIFSIAMAALESAVVVYLRELYYPDGFTVAFKLINEHILVIEIARELATLIMLMSIAYLIGHNRVDRFAYFLLSFAVWDIFYYVWLKVFIDWPTSIIDWDILFLIPITWLAPVLAPVICSLTMIVLATVILRKSKTEIFTGSFLFLLSMGCILILFTFMKDYGSLLLSAGSFSAYIHLIQSKSFVTSEYAPVSYNWLVFWIGELFICASILYLAGSNSIKRSLTTRLLNLSGHRKNLEHTGQ